MTDLIATLRKAATEPCDGCCYGDDMVQAADEIEHLRGLLADEEYIRMRAAYARGEKSWANMINEREARKS